MSEHDDFEERLRAIAEQISRSMERMSEVDLDNLAESYGVDVDRARGFANAASQWLSDRLSSGDPLFGQSRPRDRGTAAPRPSESSSPQPAQGVDPGPRSAKPGPHPLDLPTGWQGLALSALDSGRWSVGPGSNQLLGTGEGPPPPGATDAPDLVGDLRARDWIATDGTLTLVGHHALARWCRTSDDVASLSSEPDPPQT